METKIKHNVGKVKISRSDMEEYIISQALKQISEKMNAITGERFDTHTREYGNQLIQMPERLKPTVNELNKLYSDIDTDSVWINIRERLHRVYQEYPTLTDVYPNLVVDLDLRRTTNNGRVCLRLPAEKSDFSSQDLEKLERGEEYVLLSQQYHEVKNKYWFCNKGTTYKKILANTLMSSDKTTPVMEILDQIVEKLVSPEYKTFIKSNM